MRLHNYLIFFNEIFTLNFVVNYNKLKKAGTILVNAAIFEAQKTRKFGSPITRFTNAYA